MSTVTLLSWVVTAISGAFLIKQGWGYFTFYRKETKGYKVTNRKTGESTYLPKKPTQAEVKRFIDLVEH